MAITLDDLRGSRARLRRERVIRAAFFLAATVSILVSVLIVYSLIREAWTFASGVDWSTVWSGEL